MHTIRVLNDDSVSGGVVVRPWAAWSLSFLLPQSSAERLQCARTLTYAFPILGLPAISIPCGFPRAGLAVNFPGKSYSLSFLPNR